MEVKLTPYSSIKSVDGRIVTGIASVFGIVDDGGDRIHPGAFTKTIQERSNRIRYLWGHDASKPPIAVIKELREIGSSELPEPLRSMGATGGLLVTREYLPTPRADEILSAIRSGALSELSFGFDAIKASYSSNESGQTVRELHEIRLWEISDVLWGMNPFTSSVKMVIPYKDEGKAPEDESWTGPNLSDFTDVSSFEDLPLSEKKRIALHFTYSTNDPPETFGDLKLPHHRPSKTGIGPVVWNGVRAAMASLMGARGGVKIPDSDRRSVYDHLAKHYAEFDKEPPEFHMVNLVFQANQISIEEMKEGRILSKQNLERIKQAIAVLQELVSLAEPEEELPLTRMGKDVELLLQICEHELFAMKGVPK